MRFSIRSLLFVFVMVAAYFPFNEIYGDWRQSRLEVASSTYLDCENLCAIKEGDSVESVKRRFSTLIEVEPTRTLQQNLRLPSFKANDKIYRYEYPNPHGYNFLHFSEGKLTNHPKALYSDPVAMTLARGGELPSLIARINVLPAYLILLVAISISVCLVRLLRGFMRQSLKNETRPQLEVESE